MNPGPVGNTSKNDESVYHCGTCDKPVTWDDRAIMCETRDQWYHMNCQEVHTQTYNELNNSAIVWDCIVCYNPNYSSVCFDLVLSTRNQLSV